MSELAIWAIQVLHEEGDVSLYIRGVAEPFRAASLQAFDSDAEGLLKATFGSSSMIFHGNDLVALRVIDTPRGIPIRDI